MSDEKDKAFMKEVLGTRFKDLVSDLMANKPSAVERVRNIQKDDPAIVVQLSHSSVTALVLSLRGINDLSCEDYMKSIMSTLPGCKSEDATRFFWLLAHVQATVTRAMKEINDHMAGPHN